MTVRQSICVVFATVGRPAEIAKWTSLLQRQSRPPDQVIYSVAGPDDLPPVQDLFPGSTVVYGDRGLAKQRNRGLERALESSDIIVFFDDDFVPCDGWLADVSLAFASQPDVVGIDSLVIADGVKSAEIPFQEAVDRVRGFASGAEDGKPPVRQTGLYGCNMAFRSAAIGPLRFDENLPLYGWQEDVDFSSRLGRHGTLIRISSSFGVHRGVKGARLNGFRLGYSQVANPLYLLKKGSLSRKFALTLILRNMTMNHLKSFFPEPMIDRRGRLRGNWRAIIDLLSHRMDPRRILDFH